MNFRDYLTIGEVVQKLQLNFADLSVSKLRFLEDEGLIAPQRTDGGYRKYSRADLQRIEVILRLQREKFLPLAIIKIKLDEYERGVIAPELADVLKQSDTAVSQEHTDTGNNGEFVSSSGDNGQYTTTFGDNSLAAGYVNHAALQEGYTLEEDSTTISVADMVRDEKIPEQFFGELKKYKIIETTTTAQTMGATLLSAADATCARAAWKLRTVGIEPRHLRMYATFADKESGTYELLLRPTYRHKTPRSKEQLAEVAADIIRQTELLKRRLLQREMKEKLDDLL